MANLDGADIKHAVNDFLRNSNDKDVASLSASLRSFDKERQTDLVHKILGTITDSTFYESVKTALSVYIKDHPFETATFLIGIVVLSIPSLALRLPGFMALERVRPIASLVVLWKASRGGIDAANNAFILLHGWGILADVVLPAAAKVAGAVGAEVGKWGSGQYGTPVENWVRGDYGRPVEKWWNGDYGNPVSSWFGSILK